MRPRPLIKALGLAIAVTLLPALLLAEDAVYLPCLSPHGTADEYRANFVAAGWVELTDMADREIAASAAGEAQFLLTRRPPMARDSAELDETLLQMHIEGLKNAAIEKLLYFSRDTAFAQVEPAGVADGSGTDTRCIIIGPNLPGARAALDAAPPGFQMGDRLLGMHYAQIDSAPFFYVDDLHIYAIEHLLGAEPTEVLYGPLFYVVNFEVQEP